MLVPPVVCAHVLHGDGGDGELHRRVASPAVAERLAGGHNLFIQLILTPLTLDTGRTAYLIDEFGAGLAIANLIGAIIVWRKRDELGPLPLEQPR